MLWIYNKDLKKKIKQKLAKDSVAQNIIKNIAENADFKYQNEILTFQSLIYVSMRCKQKIINDYHKMKIHNHQELNKIIKRIFRTYYFFKMKKQIKNTIKNVMYT